MENNYLKYKKYKLKYLKLKEKMDGGLLVEKPKCFNSNSVYNTEECSEPGFPCVTTNLRCGSINNASPNKAGIKGVINSLNVYPVKKESINVEKIRNQIFSNKEKEKYRLKIYPTYGITYDFKEKFNISDYIGCGAYACVYKIKSLENKNLEPLIRLTQYIDSEVKGLRNQYKLKDGAFINKLYSYGAYYLESLDSKNEYNNSEELVSPLDCLDGSKELNNCKVREKSGVYGLIENCKGGELYSKISFKKGMNLEQDLDEYDYKNESSLRGLMINLLNAVKYIHSKNIIHNDLKPENIGMFDSTDSSNIRILDFGLSIDLADIEQKPISGKGTPGYAAPEHFNKGSYITNKVDIYSCGSILLTLLTRQGPGRLISENKLTVIDKNITIRTDSDGNQKFFLGNMTIMYDWIEKDIIKFINNPKDKRNVINFLYNLLESNPSKRLSATQALNHPWITQV